MKTSSFKSNCLRSLAVCLFALLVMQAFAAQKNKIFDNPLIDFANTKTIDVAKVELTKKAAILHIDARFRPKYWIKIAGDSYLKADGKKYMLTGAEGIQPDSLFWMPETGEASFTLRFEPMPADTRTFDFIESDCEECFKLYGIDLTGKKAYDMPAGLPQDVANVAIPDAVPDPIFECGQTTVRIHFLNYRPEYNIRSANLYVNTLLGKQNELEFKVDPKTGVGEVSFMQYGTANAFVVYESSSLGSAWLAPGEAVDLYVDLRAKRYLSNLRKRNGTTDAKEQASFQRMYTNGKYAGLNCLENKIDDSPYYGMELHNGEFADYHMTSSEYVDHVIKTYKSHVDSVNRYCNSTLEKEFQTISLKQQACIAMAEDLREHNYRCVYKRWREEIPADSIEPLKPEDMQRFGGLFDINDTKLLMGDYTLNFVRANFVSNDWMKKDSQPNGFMKDLQQVPRFYQKAENAQLTDEDFAELKSLSTPFFYNALSHIQAEAKNILVSTEGKIETTPDVPVEQLFDAIIAPHKGKVILVDFWNTWCGPCRAAIKHNEPLKQGELKNDDLVWIYIANETSPMATYMKMVPDIQGLHYRLNNEQWRYLTDKKFDIDGIPSYVVVGKDGKYALRNDLRDHNLLRQTLKEALAK